MNKKRLFAVTLLALAGASGSAVAASAEAGQWHPTVRHADYRIVGDAALDQKKLWQQKRAAVRAGDDGARWDRLSLGTANTGTVAAARQVGYAGSATHYYGLRI